MLYNNPMRYGADVFGEQINPGGGSATVPGGGGVVALTKSALLVAKESLDCSAVNAVTAIQIGGNQPNGTVRRFCFIVDDKLYKFTGSTVTLCMGSVTVENVLALGNTADELAALTDIPFFVGKEIYPVIALQAPFDSDFPTAKVAIKTVTATDTLTKSYTSAAYTLQGSDPTVVDADAEFALEGAGTADIKARTHDGTSWSSWTTLNNVANRKAKKIQFKSTLRVLSIGEDSAQVTGVTVRQTTGDNVVSGDSAEIFSPIVNFEVPLQSAYVIVKHSRLIDSTIDAAVAFLPKPKHASNANLGTATGSVQSFSLSHTQIDPSTLQVYLNGVQTYNFDYNLEVNEITLSAPAGTSVSAAYDYDCGVEEWLPMTRQGDQQPYGDDSYMSRFALAANLENYSKAVVRITFTRTAGTISNKTIFNGTGWAKMYVSPHKLLKSTIKMSSGVVDD